MKTCDKNDAGNAKMEIGKLKFEQGTGKRSLETGKWSPEAGKWRPNVEKVDTRRRGPGMEECRSPKYPAPGVAIAGRPREPKGPIYW
jgi:hypothetical protein